MRRSCHYWGVHPRIRSRATNSPGFIAVSRLYFNVELGQAGFDVLELVEVLFRERIKRGHARGAAGRGDKGCLLLGHRYHVAEIRRGQLPVQFDFLVNERQPPQVPKVFEIGGLDDCFVDSAAVVRRTIVSKLGMVL